MSDTNKPARWDPKQDGVDHININPRGKTRLGELLADYTRTPFVHPALGPFNSMIGFWCFVKAIDPDDSLRVLWGKSASKRGQELENRRVERFREIIFEGNYYKIDQTPELKKLLIKNQLPLAMYYLFGPNNMAINPPSAPWMIADLEKLAEMFRTGEPLKPLPPEAYPSPVKGA
jgi:hypothetical protein